MTRFRRRSNSYLHAVLESGRPSALEDDDPVLQRPSPGGAEGTSESASVRSLSMHSIRSPSAYALGAGPGEAVVQTTPTPSSSVSLASPSDRSVPSPAQAAPSFARADSRAEELIFPYHEGNTMARESGYVGTLTPPQAAALSALRQRVLAAKLNIDPHRCLPAESQNHFLLRFLRARQFSVDKAWDMLSADIAWREEYGVLALRDRSMAAVVQCDENLVHHHLPIWHAGFDLQGRPVIYKR